MDDEQVNQMRLDAADLLLGSAQSLGFEGKKIASLQSIAMSNLVIAEYLQRIDRRK